MRLCVTYWYHSCFTVEMEDKVLLFDYPGRGMDRHKDSKINAMVEGSKLYVFFSHVHGDHFSPEVTKFIENAEKTHLLLSSDIPVKSITEKISDEESLTSMKPEELYNIDDIEVRTWKSNDAGLAFLINYKEKKIYYGGDLAMWNWPEWNEEKVKEHVKVFDDVIEELKDENVDIAFSNMDERLPSWSGPVEFIEKVKPKYFVPMHTFGNEDWIDDLIEAKIDAGSEIFHYESPGDRFCREV
ncbi:MAG: MBL fold metallo-hydrolase [Thermoplasmata archaeon]